MTESTVWTHGVFRPGRHALSDLVDRARTVDFAIMVLGADDDVESRSEKAQAPRDNVVFELGLFMGALGPERTYMVLPAGVKLKLPTDLAGITHLPYPARADKNMAAALSGVVINIIDEIKLAGSRGETADQHPQLPADPISARDVENDLRILRSNLTPQGWTFRWNETRTRLRAKSPSGSQRILKMGDASSLQTDFNQFIRELRGLGARFDTNLRRR